MATWNPFNTATTQKGSADAGGQAVSRIQATIDLNHSGGLGFGTTFASGDIIQIANLPAGAVVLAAGVQVVTAGSGTGTFALGDTGSATRFTAATAVNATSYTAGVTAHVYTAQDTLQITVGTANVTTGVYTVWALVANMNDARPAAYPGAI